MITCTNLANAYLIAGRTAEAIVLHERAAAGLEQVLGVDHRDTLEARSDLAAAYLKTNEAGTAIRLYESILAAQERVHGAGHPHAQTARDHLAAAYLAAGQHAKIQVPIRHAGG